MSEQELELPKGWVKTTLEHILETLEAGKRPKGGVKQSVEGIPSLGGEHLNDQGGFKFEKIKFIPPEFFENISKGHINLNDILIVKDGATTGKTSFVRKDFPYSKSAVNEHVFILRGYSSLVVQEFLFYYLFSLQGQQLIKKKGSGLIGGINTSFVEEFTIPICPLNEQKRIVSKIEELFSKIDSTKQSLEQTKLQLEQYRHSLLKSAFEGKLTEVWRKRNNLESLDETLNIIDNECRNSKFTHDEESQLNIPDTWKTLKIARSIIFLGSGITPKGGQANYHESGIPFIRSQNVYPDGLHLENIVYVSKELHQKMSRTHTKDKDVLLNITGASIGRSCIIPENFGSANVNQHVCILRFHEKINSLFLSYWLNSPVFQGFISFIQQGETRQALNFEQIKNMLFPFCSLEEQEQIVSQIERGFSLIENTQSIVNSTLQTLQTMKMSVLKQAFEGKLVPQDPNDEPAHILLEKIKSTKEAQPTKKRRAKNVK